MKANPLNSCCYFLIILAIATRFIPHPAGMTAVGAVGLFSGAYLCYKRAWLVPVAALWISDIIIGFYHPLVMLFVYSGFGLSVVIGRICLFQRRSIARIGAATVIAATVFFMLSNLGVWLTGLYYPLTITGLLECYIMAIPFFERTLVGDMIYVAVLFGLYEFIHARFKRPIPMQSA